MREENSLKHAALGYEKRGGQAWPNRIQGPEDKH